MKEAWKTAWNVLLYVATIAVIGVVILGVYRFIVLSAPPVGVPSQTGATHVLDKLGAQTTVAVILTMTALLALVFWLFIQFGRRVSARGYLGPLTKDAIARAEIARQEDNLREELHLGKIKMSLDPRSTDFKNQYRIPLAAELSPPNLTAGGITIDEAGRILLQEEWRTGTGSGSTSTDARYSPFVIQNMSAEHLYKEWSALKEELQTRTPGNGDPNKGREISTNWSLLQQEIDRRFREGYRRAYVLVGGGLA